MKKISVVTACYNEHENVAALVEAVDAVFEKLPDYTHEHIFIDNDSEDNTVAILKDICKTKPHVKVIVNSRNFGHIRSPFYGLVQAEGDAVLSLVADFQDPPELIPEFIKKWEQGNPIVVGIKKSSREKKGMFAIRKFYYRLVRALSEVDLLDGFTGFGLYDQKIIKILREVDDPYPYFRGLICEIGFNRAEVSYEQPVRKAGKTKNNFFSLFDMAMTGFTSTSKVPMRIATLSGFMMSLLSLVIMVVYIVLKLMHWKNFTAGTAPILIGVFFFASVQLFFIGVLGEYIASINTRVIARPLVFEKERINFDEGKDQ
ncbi:MAG: glycosyltransferase family 2 protein [Eubacteriales bacterium]